jgi:hypothetical protein
MPSAFLTQSRTYRVLNRELESRIRKEFSVNKGKIGAIRWQKKNGEYSDWRVEVYWREGGRLHHKILGKLADMLARLRVELAVD